MAIIKYQINGKADLSPLKETSAAAEGMFKKIEAIDNKFKAFIGIKVFQQVSKTIKESLKEYDSFKKSIEGELNISKQMTSLKKSFSATLGTIRDELFSSFNNVFNNGSMFDNIKEILPKLGANLIAAMKVVEKIVINIKTNFENIIRKQTWNNFFEQAKVLASDFCTFFASILRDVFAYSVDFFKWALEDLNIFEVLWMPAKKFFSKIVDFLRGMGSKIDPWVDKALGNEEGKKALKKIPAFNFSSETNNALSSLASSLKNTADSFLNTLAGENVKELFNREYTSALEKLRITIKAMTEAAEDNTKEIKELLDVYKKEQLNIVKDNLNSATKGFSNSASNIHSILGNANSDAIQKVRDNMKFLNEQFEISTKSIDKLEENLKAAKTIEEIDAIFNSIKQNIDNIGSFTSSMNSLEKDAIKAKLAFDLMEGSLQAIGDLSVVIEAIITKNWIGMLITLIARLASSFSNISENAAAAQNILDVLFDVIESLLDDLGESLDSIFKPLLDITTALGTVIGSILRLVINVITPLANLINNFNFLIPILNGVSIIIATLTDVLGHLFNFIFDIIRTITFGLVDLGRMQTNNLEKVLDSINQENSYSDYQNNSTNYSVSGDIFLNLYFEHSYINGSAREIALAIRDEIRLAESNGY